MDNESQVIATAIEKLEENLGQVNHPFVARILRCACSRFLEEHDNAVLKSLDLPRESGEQLSLDIETNAHRSKPKGKQRAFSTTDRLFPLHTQRMSNRSSRMCPCTYSFVCIYLDPVRFAPLQSILFHRLCTSFHPQMIYVLVSSADDFLRCFFAADCNTSFSILVIALESDRPSGSRTSNRIILARHGNSSDQHQE